MTYPTLRIRSTLVSAKERKRSRYQHLKNYCNNKFKANLIEWGYIRDKESEDKKLKDELKQIAEDIQNLFDRLGFEDLGKGPQKADFDVRWQDISYPVEGSERVTSKDEIGFTVRIKVRTLPIRNLNTNYLLLIHKQAM